MFAAWIVISDEFINVVIVGMNVDDYNICNYLIFVEKHTFHSLLFFEM